jgi:cyclomaltodextrinase / maltogenic alpha-amylase / neopullulanase
MDFIFGTLATDELKVVHHRARWQGIQHDHELSPRDPQPGQPVTLTVRTGTGVQIERVACYYTLDNTLPMGSRGQVTNGQVLMLEPVGSAWDTIAWSYQTIWQAVIPAQPLGTIVRYRISGWVEGSPEIFADWPNTKDTAEAAAGMFFRGETVPTRLAVGDPQGQTFCYHVDTFRPPTWARDAIIYQIFVDRFYAGHGNPWLQTNDLNGFCGGTLWGVAEQMEYVADLGVNCIWLSPTWTSPSHHGYDATDYHQTEARLGGDAALRAVVEAAHKRGIRVLLDLVCNHISNEHPLFVGAKSSPADPHRDWFIFDDSALGYRSFFGVPSMPQLNLQNPAARDWMIGVAQYWLREFKVDGYRLDYAHGPGPDFWVDFRAGCRAVNPDCYCFGEVVDAPDVLQTYVGRLDGCLDFHLGEALRRTYGWGTMTEAEFHHFARGNQAYFPTDFVMPTFIDNHDMDRFIFIAKGDKVALRQAARMQMQQPGPPIIYYGTEVGLSQATSVREGLGLHINRTPMLWGDAQDKLLLRDYQELIHGRNAR